MADCLNKKGMDNVWNKTFDKLTKLETTFKTKMEAFASSDKAVEKLLQKAKDIKLKNVAIGAGIGIGIYALYKIGQSVFGSKNKA